MLLALASDSLLSRSRVVSASVTDRKVGKTHLLDLLGFLSLILGKIILYTYITTRRFTSLEGNERFYLIARPRSFSAALLPLEGKTRSFLYKVGSIKSALLSVFDI